MDELNTNWVRFYRKAMDSTVWQKVEVWYVWSWCLYKANFKDAKFQFNGVDIQIKRGQFVTGRNKALEELPALTAQKWRTAINYLKSTSRITTEVTNKYTIITICKYDDYQKENGLTNQQNFEQTNQPLTNQQPTTNQQLTTYKNDKKDKNEKKGGEEKKFTPPTLEEVIKYFKECGYNSENARRAWNYYKAAGWKNKKGIQIDNWKQIMATWFDEESRFLTHEEMLAERKR